LLSHSDNDPTHTRCAQSKLSVRGQYVTHVPQNCSERSVRFQIYLAISRVPGEERFEAAYLSLDLAEYI